MDIRSTCAQRKISFFGCGQGLHTCRQSCKIQAEESLAFLTTNKAGVNDMKKRQQITHSGIIESFLFFS